MTTDKSNCKVYAHIVKHNYVFGGMLFTIRKTQLHVSATNVFWWWPKFVAETCSCALHIVNSTPPNTKLCLTIYAYTLQFDLFDTQWGWRTSKKWPRVVLMVLVFNEDASHAEIYRPMTWRSTPNKKGTKMEVSWEVNTFNYVWRG